MEGRKLFAYVLLATTVSAPFLFSAEGSSIDDELLAEINARGISVQNVYNPTDIEKQHNINSSVQLNGDSQRNGSGMEISNIADSAANLHQNVLKLENSEGVRAEQSSNQSSSNAVALRQSVINEKEATDQENLSGSVQLNGESQSFATSSFVTNAAASAIGSSLNILYASFVDEVSFVQGAEQTSYNETSSIFSVDNGEDLSNMNNNALAVQLNGASQSGASALKLQNGAASAMNLSQNIAEISAGSDMEATQNSRQSAMNFSEFSQQITNEGYLSKDQNNNSASVELNMESQKGVSAAVVANSAMSANNISQNLFGADGAQGGVALRQTTSQRAQNLDNGSGIYLQEVSNEDSRNQKNNHASLQLNGQAQEGSSAMIVSNVVASAANTYQSVANIEGGSLVADVRVSATQGASNYSKEGIEQRISGWDAYSQTNLSGSLQLNDNAQRETNGLLIENGAAGATNVSQSIVRVAGAEGFNDIAQSATQVAYNGKNSINVLSQDILNDDEAFTLTSVIEQDNLNGSLQLNDGSAAQDGVSAMALLNGVNSALNAAQNIAAASNDENGNSFIQRTYQIADSEILTSQSVNSLGEIVNVEYSDNLNGSVQIKSGQNGFNGALLFNGSASAVNIAQNVAFADNIDGINEGFQFNRQNSSLEGETVQTVRNEADGSLMLKNQNNNSAAVQIVGGGNDIAALAVSNAAFSSMNLSQNVAFYSSVTNSSTLGQYAAQSTEIDAMVDQSVVNSSENLYLDYQQNNNGSIQLIATQNGYETMVLSNSAASAVNISQNVATIEDVSGTDTVEQQSTQSAYSAVDSVQRVLFEGVDLAIGKQNNNNASVQLNGAQNDFRGFAIVNSVSSAVNAGQNVAFIENPNGMSQIVQNNYQDSFAVASFNQEIINGGGDGQNNNNGVVQLNGSQNDISSYVVLNSIGSAVDSETNIASINGSRPDGTDLDQMTMDDTVNDSSFFQSVENALESENQNNNNSSVQLNDSQIASNAVDLSNTAGSAHNYGNNITNLYNSSGWVVNQAAVQSAINY